MEFIKAFEEIDKDDSGEISRAGLEEYMRSKNYKPGFVDKWLRIFDVDNSGTISLEEFCNTLGLIPGKKQKERIERRKSIKQMALKDQEEIDREAERKEEETKEKEKQEELDRQKEEERKRKLEREKELQDKLEKQKEKEREEKLERQKKEERKRELERELDNADRSEYGSTTKSSSILVRVNEIKDNAVIIIAEDPDISNDLREFVLKLSLESVLKYKNELEVAKNVKTILDANYKRCWHVVVGKDAYGCLVTHEEGNFIHVKVKNWGILMWQVLKL